MTTNYDVILKFILDQPSKQKSVKGIEDLVDAFDKLDDEAKTLTAINLDRLRAQLDQIEEKFQAARKAAEDMQRVSEKLRSISTPLFATGAAIVGGMFAAANKEANRIKEAGGIVDATTQRWLKANVQIQQSQQRIGRAAEKALLPTMEKAAAIAEKIAGLVEKNPEGILRAGEIIGGVGVIGLAVAKGIQIKASLDYLAANAEFATGTKRFESSVNKFLGTAVLGKGGVNIPSGDALDKLPGGRFLKNIPVITFALTVGASASLATSKAFDQLAEEISKAGKLGQAAASGIQVANHGLEQFIDQIQKVGAATGSTGSVGGRTPITNPDTTRISTETFNQALKIYEDYKDDDLALVQQHYEDRAKIVSGALANEQAENAKYAASVTKINTQTSSALANAAADFARANAQAEQKYQEGRAQIVRDGNEAIERIEADSKERLRKLAKEHNERVADLTAARDALGLVKEQRNYRDQVSEEKRNTQREVQQRRADIAQRLADLKQSYEEERAQRLADYQARVAEIQANAAQQLAELQQQHEEELHKIQEQKVARLRELDSQFVEERKRRYNQAVQQLRDLDAALLGETRLQQQYHQLMLQDLDNFLATYQAKASSAFAQITATGTTSGTTGGFTHNAAGGYAGYGIHMLGEEGREFVLSHRTTRAAEEIIGSGLTQDALLSALAKGAGNSSGRSLTIGGNWRFDGRLSAAQVRAIQKGAVDEMAKLLLK